MTLLGHREINETPENIPLPMSTAKKLEKLEMLNTLVKQLSDLQQLQAMRKACVPTGVVCPLKLFRSYILIIVQFADIIQFSSDCKSLLCP